MTAAYNAGVHRYAIFLAVCTFLLLIAGGLVTSNEAALSVPDWPLSYGTLTPPMVGGIRRRACLAGSPCCSICTMECRWRMPVSRRFSLALW